MPHVGLGVADGKGLQAMITFKEKTVTAVVLMVIAAIIVALSGCQNRSALGHIFESDVNADAQIYESGANAEAQINKLSTLYINRDMAVAQDLADMVDIAAYIVVGRYSRFDPTWNAANKMPEEDTERYTESRLYRFVVDEVLKGELADEDISVSLMYSTRRISIESDAKWDETGRITKEATVTNEVSFFVHEPLYIEPVPDTVYILFLYGTKDLDVYCPALEPASIIISPDGNASLLSNLIGMTDAYFEEVVQIDESRSVTVYTSAVSIEDWVSGQTFDSVRAQILARVALILE